MLDEFAGFVNGFDGFCVLAILGFPNRVLLVSGGLFSSISGLVVSDILNDLSEISLRTSEGFNGVVSELSVSRNLRVVIVDVVLEVCGYSVASSLISSVHLVVSGLILDEACDDLVEQHVNFVDGALGLELGFDG